MVLESRRLLTRRGKTKRRAYRWRERYLERGVGGLRRDASRPGRKTTWDITMQTRSPSFGRPRPQISSKKSPKDDKCYNRVHLKSWHVGIKGLVESTPAQSEKACAQRRRDVGRPHRFLAIPAVN
jgi:hypothetical protein